MTLPYSRRYTAPVNKKQPRHKRVTGNRSFTDFAVKLSAKWRLHTLPNKKRDIEPTESTEDILRDLVAIPTVSDNYEARHEAIEYIDQFLRSHGMIVKRHEWNGVESLTATTRPTKAPILFLTGHIDVVPASAGLFKLRKDTDRYYGRGVLDMKGAVAAFLGAVRELHQSGQLHTYDFGVMVVSDEEVGGFDGAAKLADEGYVPQVMVLPDGGANWNIERFAKGIWHLTVEARGKSAHGSRPWEGKNAIETIMAAIHDIRALFPSDMSIETSTINVGMIQGGEAINQIPGSATASFDMRFASLADQERITAKVSDIIERYSLTRVTELETPPVVSDPHHPYLQAYADCTESVTGRKPEWIISNAGNDGRFFVTKGVQCIVAYPEGGNHHGAKEYISVKSLDYMQRLFVAYIQQVARIPEHPTHV